MEGSGFFLLLVIVVVVVAIFLFIKNGHETAVNLGQAKKAGSAQKAAALSQKDRQRMAQDIRMLKTSQVKDAVDILADLSKTSPGYRHYCELTGTTAGTGGVLAPYSRRQVAYYDVRAYRIENINGEDRETLIAREKSIEPFNFTDSSTDTPVYVDLDSFGDNIILLQSMNRIEGPTSEFAKAVSAGGLSTGNAGASGSGSSSTASLAVPVTLEDLTRALGLAGWRGVNVLRARCARLQQLLQIRRPRIMPAYAGVYGYAYGSSYGAATAPGTRSGSARSSSSTTTARLGVSAGIERQVIFFAGPGGPGGRGPGGPGGGPGFGGPGAGRRSSGRGPGADGSGLEFGRGFDFDDIPQGLGAFLGGLGSAMEPHSSKGRPSRHENTDLSVLGGLGGIALASGLGALLGSLSRPEAQPTTIGQPQAGTFRGYRLVEDVVPLNSPVYCIGEIYYNGDQVYMGRSLATDYTTSFFATKPESEVLSRIQQA